MMLSFGLGLSSVPTVLPTHVHVPASPYAVIPNLRFAFLTTVGHCYTDNPPTVLAGIDDSVETVVCAAGTGPSGLWENFRPVLRANGLECGLSSDAYIELSPDVIPLTNCTMYITGYVPPGGASTWIYGHTTLATILASFYSQILYQDGIGGGGSGGNLEGEVLLRVGFDGDGNAHISWSGDGTEIVHFTSGPFVINAIGATPSQSAYDEGGSTHRLLLVVNEFLTYNSAEDMFVRGIILAEDGAEIIQPI